MTARRPAPPRPRRTPPPPPRRAKKAARKMPPPPPKRAPRPAPPIAAEPSFDGEATARMWSAHEALGSEPEPPPPSRLETTNTKLSPPPSELSRRERAAEARKRGDAAARRLNSMAQMVELHPGDTIADRYRINAVLGRGRGLLLDASHTAFDQRVVARVISPALADHKAVDRFQRETRILSSSRPSTWRASSTWARFPTARSTSCASTSTG